MLPKHGDEIINAIEGSKETGARLLSDAEYHNTLTGILEKFNKTRRYEYPIWDNLSSWVGVDL